MPVMAVELAEETVGVAIFATFTAFNAATPTSLAALNAATKSATDLVVAFVYAAAASLATIVAAKLMEVSARREEMAEEHVLPAAVVLPRKRRYPAS